MKHLMIHDISREYFNLGLEQYRLTFDDGLFSQYYYYPKFRSRKAPLIYFVTTSFIRPGAARRMFAGEYLPFIKSKQYMYDTFIHARLDHFMTTEEIGSLAGFPNVQIGAHSHFHDVIPTRTRPGKIKPLSRWKSERFKHYPDGFEKEFSLRSRLAFQGYLLQEGLFTRRKAAAWEDFIRYDTEKCLKWFESNLGFTPDIYCFPFNEYSDKMISILKSYGFKKFYGARGKGHPDIIERVDIDRLAEQRTSS